MTVLCVRDLRVRYSAKGPEILKGIDFDVQADDFMAIIGPSGAGKSTLIRCINRLVEPSSGKITLLDQDVRSLSPKNLRGLRRDVGMIFQEFNLINRMSVMDNVLSGRLGYTGNLRTLFRHFSKPDIELALEYLDRVGLSDHIDKRADELSGGQRQRVGIARALMQKPKLLLLDEPTSALDHANRDAFLALLLELLAELGCAMLFVSHDQTLGQHFDKEVTLGELNQVDGLRA